MTEILDQSSKYRSKIPEQVALQSILVNSFYPRKSLKSLLTAFPSFFHLLLLGFLNISLQGKPDVSSAAIMDFIESVAYLLVKTLV